jgi:hypothetical protein
MKQACIEFFVNRFWHSETAEDCDISFLTPINRRRLSDFDKFTMATFNNIFTDEVENIVFSSQTGESDKLMKIINQYTSEGEVSPNTFTGSVHNFSTGFFLLNKQKSIPYTTISASGNSITLGILGAVISRYNNTAFCYTDKKGESFFSLGLNISKQAYENSDKYRIILNPVSNLDDNYADFIGLFSRQRNSIATSQCIIERVL